MIPITPYQINAGDAEALHGWAVMFHEVGILPMDLEEFEKFNIRNRRHILFRCRKEAIRREQLRKKEEYQAKHPGAWQKLNGEGEDP